MKIVLYKILFPLVYRIGCMKRFRSNQVLFVQVRGESLSNNFKLLWERLEKTQAYDIRSICLQNGTVSQWHYLWNCLKLLWIAAQVKYVFLDEGCNVLGCVNLRSETILTQMWHACGAFKKFGFSIADSGYGASYDELVKYPYYRNTTYVTVSSPEVIWAYEEAMGVPKNNILPIGVSRTDIFFNKTFCEMAKRKLYQCMPEAVNKKVILYAPTFRGNMKEARSPELIDIKQLMDVLKDSYVIVCKHHPYVKQPPDIPRQCGSFARDLTEEMSIEELLCVSDICISDYSSLVFEYSLFERPIIFFAGDEMDYCGNRGFYYDYQEMTPGPVVRTPDEIIEQIRLIEQEFDGSQIRAFREKYMSACDGHATERLFDLIFDTGGR